ncbi:MAG TPA: hypothetical protein VKB88_21555 [Bryobacteraceae bacterium]|nr:hypothetical protein [Bryobacteraceae bacterium]
MIPEIVSTQPSTFSFPRKARKFLEAFASTGRVDQSCAIAGYSRETHYQKLKTDEAYRAAFAAAEGRFADVIEAEVVRRAIDCESDALLMFLARGAMPNKYRDRASVEHSGTIDLAEHIQQGRRRLLEMKRDESATTGS